MHTPQAAPVASSNNGQSPQAAAAAQSVIEMGFAADSVRQVQSQQLAAVGQCYENAEELLQAVLAISS